METSGFYKLDNGQILYAQQFVEAPDYSLKASEKDSYTYPINGWYWFDSEEEAKANFSQFFKTLTDKLNELSSDVQVIKEKANMVTPEISALPIVKAKETLHDQLDLLSDELTVLITKVRLANDPEPTELTNLIEASRGLYGFALNEINALTEENYKSYILRGPQVEGLFSAIKSFLPKAE